MVIDYKRDNIFWLGRLESRIRNFYYKYHKKEN